MIIIVFFIKKNSKLTMYFVLLFKQFVISMKINRTEICSILNSLSSLSSIISKWYVM